MRWGTWEAEKQSKYPVTVTEPQEEARVSESQWAELSLPLVEVPTTADYLHALALHCAV